MHRGISSFAAFIYAEIRKSFSSSKDETLLAQIKVQDG